MDKQPLSININILSLIEPKLLLFLGSITLGAIGALTLSQIRKLLKREEEASPPKIRMRARKNSFLPSEEEENQNEVGVPKFEYPRLRVSKETLAQNLLAQELKRLEDITCEIEKIPNLVCDLGHEQLDLVVNPMFGDSKYRSVFGGEGFLPDSAFISSDCFILQRPDFGPNDLLSRTKRWLRAGPRKHLFFTPQESKAAIIVGGGLCPGINTTIRELVMTLHDNYNVTNVKGIMFGFNGILENQWVDLNPKIVQTIHHKGGSFLGTSRGKYDVDRTLKELVKRGINQFYLIGGNGTMICVYELMKKIKEQKLKISCVVIPKSQENDIPIVDKSFGFETGVEVQYYLKQLNQEAQLSIITAYAESHSRNYAVGIVRLSGRYTGFLAMEASFASRSVNICLIPEFSFDLYGKRGLLNYIFQRIKAKGSCVIVVSYGTSIIISLVIQQKAQALRDYKVKDEGKDASGNIMYGDIGQIIKDEIHQEAKNREMDVEVKYIDPEYLIRAGKGNALDSKMCTQLAQNAVHGVMAGYTGFAVGHVSNYTCLIPLDEMLSGNYSNRVQVNQSFNQIIQKPSNSTWQRLLASTGQPSFLNDESVIIQKQ